MADNPDEIFDIVDERDEVIGTARRADVHAGKLRHRAVHILVSNSRGDLFLQKRSLSKDSQPGKWDSSASGHLDTGESYGSAALREVREELGVVVDEVREIVYLPASDITGQEFVRIYQARHEGPFRLHPGEIADGKWISVPALDEWIRTTPDDFAGCFLEVWRQSRSHY